MGGLKSSGTEVREFLQGHALFSDLDDSCITRLANASRFRRIGKGEILFFQSDASDSAFIIRSGKISILLNGPDGREMVIEELRAGELLGEVGLLTKQGRSASAVAKSNSELVVIPRDAFLRVIEEQPILARRVLGITAERLQLSVHREMALAFMNAQGRLARYLLSLEAGERDKGYVTVSQEDLARGTGLIRQTVAKVLGTWRRDGWLLTGRGRILILDRKALEAVEKGPIDLAVVSSK